jgi:hypothetical protein
VLFPAEQNILKIWTDDLQACFPLDPNAFIVVQIIKSQNNKTLCQRISTFCPTVLATLLKCICLNKAF